MCIRTMFFTMTFLPFVFCGQVRSAPGYHQSYAVVVSRSTADSPEWAKVVRAIESGHQGRVIIYQDNVADSLNELKAAFPMYACFVAKPEEATRSFIASVHTLTRRLDDDPYTDVIWAVLTGYTADDALRIAEYDKPLIVKKVLTATVGSPPDCYEEGLMFSELRKDIMWQKTPDGRIEQKACPTDTTKMIVSALNDYRPDIFITSGHATERDWQIGYDYPNGSFRCQDGRLYGLDTEKKRYDINSPNPKVHLAVGNCLIANIPGTQCMALALIHSAGVYQMLGYTVPTGYGYGGWGVKDYFSELQAGRFTLSQANYANNIALVYELEKRGQNDSDPGKLGGGIRGDRDVVVLYGDPAWQVRLPQRPLPWTQQLSVSNGTYAFTITANEKGDWDNRPVVELLPHRVKNISITEGSQYKPVITDNFILVGMRDELLPMKGNRGEVFPIRGDYDKGQTFRVVFKAERVGY